MSSPRSGVDIEDHLSVLLARVSSDLAVWRELATRFRVEVFCGLFLDVQNRGFELPAQLMRELADRHISIGFDIYAPES